MPRRADGCSCSWGSLGHCSQRSWPRSLPASWPRPSAGSMRSFEFVVPIAVTCARSRSRNHSRSRASSPTAGVVLGLLSTAIVLGATTVFAATTAELIRSATLSATVGLVVTAIALYVPARRFYRDGSQRTTAGTSRRAPASMAKVRSRCRPRGRSGGPGDRRRSGRCARPTGWVGVLRDRRSPCRRPAVHPPPLVGGWAPPVRPVPRRPRVARARAGAPFRTGRSRCLGSEPPSSRGRSRRWHPGAWSHRCVRNRVGVVRGDLRCSEGRRHAVHPGLRHPIMPSVLATGRPGADDASAFLVPGVAAVSPVVFDVENAVDQSGDTTNNARTSRRSTSRPSRRSRHCPIRSSSRALRRTRWPRWPRTREGSWWMRERRMTSRSTSAIGSASSSPSARSARPQIGSVLPASSNGSPACRREPTWS